MNAQFFFWFAIGLCVTVLVLLALRELVLLHRLPPSHHERGQCWFNAGVLYLSAVAVLCGGQYVDSGRYALEAMIEPYRGARYAFEQSGVFHSTSWVYETKESKDAVVDFYRTYAKAHNILLLEDESSGTRLSFLLPSGNLFLTIKEEIGLSILYFTREGEVQIVSRP